MNRADVMHDAKMISLGAVVGMLLCAVFAAWINHRPSPPSVIAPIASELVSEKPKTLKCKDVIVFRDKIKDELGLPEEIKKDPSKHVAAATRIDASDNPTTVSAVYDDVVGRIDLFKRQDPQPWLAFDRRAELGVSYLFKDKAPGEAAGAVVALDGRIALLRIKALRGGFVGQLDSSGGWQLGGRAWAEWR